MIEFREIQKIYPGQRSLAIKNASFRVEKNEFVFLMGKSGAGKSTLLKMMYRDEKPSEGKILIAGEDITKMKLHEIKRRIGSVFQSYDLLPNKTAYENVAYVMECFGKGRRETKMRSLELLNLMDLTGKEKRFPSELSGGEQQRVAIARAMANKPDILLCDEPTGNLDDESAENVVQYLRNLNQRGTTIVMATHNTRVVRKLKKRVLVVENGKVVERNSADIGNGKDQKLTSLIEGVVK